MTVDPNSQIKLILNISEDDFNKGKLEQLAGIGNYIIVTDNQDIEYEISSSQAKRLLSQDLTKNWMISFRKSRIRSLDESPKEIFGHAMWMLWGAS